MDAGLTGANDFSFGDINAKARGLPKGVDKTHRQPKISIITRGDGEIVSTRVRRNIRRVVNSLNQDIITNNEKEGGKRAALLHATLDDDPDLRGTPEGRTHFAGVKEAAHNIPHPGWQPSSFNRGMNKAVVDRVERLGRIHKEDKIIGVAVPSFHNLIEVLIEIMKVVFKNPTLYETFLRGVQRGSESRRDDGHDRFGNNAVVRISDRDRSRVLGEESTCFGDEEEQTVVEALRWKLPSRQAAKNHGEDRRRVSVDSAVSSEGDAVWTWGGVVRAKNGLLQLIDPRDAGDEVWRDNTAKVAVVPFGLNALLCARPGRPQARPEARGDTSHGSGVSSGSLVSRAPKGVETNTGGGQSKADAPNGVGTGARSGSASVFGLLLNPSVLKEGGSAGTEPADVFTEAKVLIEKLFDVGAMGGVGQTNGLGDGRELGQTVTIARFMLALSVRKGSGSSVQRGLEDIKDLKGPTPQKGVRATVPLLFKKGEQVGVFRNPHGNTGASTLPFTIFNDEGGRDRQMVRVMV